MTRATSANRLYVIAERRRGRDEFAPAEPSPDGRALLAAALTRRGPKSSRSTSSDHTVRPTAASNADPGPSGDRALDRGTDAP